MTSLNTLLRGGAVAAIVGFGALVATAPAASAYTVCNRHGDCWHSDHRYYIPHVAIRFYGDNWNWRRHHYQWHDHDGDGRGYWDRDRNEWHDYDHDGDRH